jgi:flagellar basal-body rod modification protein FlgD
MTPITSANPTNAAAASAATSSAATTKRASLANNFETFLTLLTAQLKNQDPLSPLDSKDFTNQLVQFSGVEQQLKTNDLLSSLTESTKLSAGATAVAYLGKEATANSAIATIPAGGNATWNYEIPRAAEAVSLRVLDSSGRVIAIASGETTRGEKAFQWDGKDQSGRAVTAGTYRLEINAKGADDQPIIGSVSRRGIISAVDLSGATPSVTIAGASVPLSSITKIGLQS